MRGADTGWDAAAAAVYRRRLALGIRSQRELAKRAGVSYNTVNRLERGVPSNRRNPSWPAIEAALEWPEGRIADMVEGRETPPEPPPPSVLIRQAVLAAVAKVRPDVTVQQAQEIADATMSQLRQDGLLRG